MKTLTRAFLILVFGILYIPMAVLVLFSFNASKSTGSFGGFSLRWYAELFSTPATFVALRNTLLLAVCSALIATVIGTMAAVGINKMKKGYLKTAVMSVTNVPMMNPDIVTGISMMLLFVFVGALLGTRDSLSFWTMLIAHVTFNLPYVILSVLPKLRQMDKNLPEAALDLGCTPVQAFFKVELHAILPGIITGMMMAFTLSLDDFVISFFTSGSDFQTLPLLIYSMTKKEVTPDMYALSTLVMAAIFILILITNIRKEKATEKEKHPKKNKVLAFSGIAALVVIFGVAVFMSGRGEKPITLNVYNWGEYISDGSEGSLDVNKSFEEYCKREYNLNVKVNYSTFDSNESMYNKLKSGAVSYDVVFPSEYMIERMIAEDMLETINIGNITNYGNIYDEFKTLDGSEVDPNAVYYVPYFCGYIGIIYNTKYVDPEDVADKSWDLLWNSKYKGKILQFNNPRDAFGTVMYKNGVDVNMTDGETWKSCLSELKSQKPLVQSYVMDEIFNKMKNESAYIAAYYAGDYLSMYEENPNLAFYFPKEGTNVFFDGMCIPKGSRNKELAEMYINFMLTRDAATANAEMVYYATPNKLVNENPEYIEYMSSVHENAMEYLDPKFDEDYVRSYYKNLDESTLAKMNSLWEELKIDSSTGVGLYIACGAIAIAIVGVFVFKAVRKKKRMRFY